MSDNQFNITIDDSVYKRVEELVIEAGNEHLMLRISVNAGGCSGFSYEYDLVDSAETGDFISAKNGAKVIIDKLSQRFMANSIIKYEEDLGRSCFKVINPLAQHKCGCGNSFSM